MILEICAFNIQSCITAQQQGATRIELCADPLQGGTTPSYGTIAIAKKIISIPVIPIIRPRGGNFIYDADELAIMKMDIEICKQLGCEGISTGCQLPGGNIDVEKMKWLVDCAYPMSVTCHKVFDSAPDPYKALEDVVASGCTRVLTSGTAHTAAEGISVLRQLVAQAGSRITIMPGGSVRSSNISDLIAQTGAQEFHSSALINKANDFFANAQEVHALVNGINKKSPTDIS